MQADDLDLDTQAEKLEDLADHPTKPEVKEQLVNAIALQPVLHDTSNKCDNIQSIVIGKHHKSPKSEGPTSPAIVFEKDASDKWVLPETTNSPIGTGPSESSTASPSPLSKISDNSADKVAKAEVLSNLSAISSSNVSPRKSVPDQSPLSGKSSSPSRKGFETEDSSPKKSDQDDLKRYSQVDDLKRRGRAFFQGIVENFTTQSTNRTAIGDSEEQSVQRETMIKEDRASWKQLLLNWQSKTDIPSQKKLRAMCWRGIPSSCRGEAWFAIIGNDLKITKDLYKILLSRTTSSSADAISKEDSANLIEVDAPRTFPELQFFHGDGPMRAPLVNILKTYVSFRPDVGYIQGMSYIAAMLLLNLDDECKAFISLANLLNRELYFTLFRDFQSGRAHLNVFDKLLQKHVPRCAQKFKELQLTSDMYLYDWILTIFSRSFPLDIACRIWDCFLVYGQVFMFRAALGVLKMYERAFLQSNFEQCLHLLNRIPRNMDENLLFQNIYSISISDKSLNAMLSKVQTLS